MNILLSEIQIVLRKKAIIYYRAQLNQADAKDDELQSVLDSANISYTCKF